MGRFNITLQNGTREFSAYSNFPEELVFIDAKKRKWDRVIFLLHGFPDTKMTFKDIWDVITNNLGENVLLLAPAMRGYEMSSIKGGDDEYQLHKIAGDVNNWIKSVVPNNDVPVHLFGHDWGAIVSYKTAQLYPGSITSMVCMAIPYLHSLTLFLRCPRQIYLSSYFWTMQLKSIYKSKLMEQRDGSYLDSLYRFWSPNWTYAQEEIKDVKDTFQNEKIVDAVTAYYRCIVWPLYLRRNMWRYDFDKVPTLILAGEADGCMDKALFEIEKAKYLNEKNLEIKILSKLGHFMHREDPKKVGELASSWFVEHS